MRSFFSVVQSRKMAALLLLGFSSGLPLFLTSRTLQVWMREQNVDLGVIGLFAAVALPYSLKFLWSPLLDRFSLPFLGRRRGWLLVTQIGLLLAIGAIALQNPTQDVRVLQVLAITALVVSFLSATQDIAGDAYRTDILEPHELEAGASVWVIGYRVALLATSFLALVLADYLPWNTVYLIMAALMLVGVLTTLWAPEPRLSEQLESHAPPSQKEFFILAGMVLLIAGLMVGLVQNVLPPQVFYWVIAALIVGWLAISFLMPRRSARLDNPLNNPLNNPQNYSLSDAIYQPFQEFFQRFGVGQGGLVLLFILLYKLGDSLVGTMALPFLVDIQFTKTQIGTIQGGMGFFATTIGVLAGGAVLTKLGINRCLWIFGILQLLSNLGYYALAVAGKNDSLMVLAINLENFCAGLVTVVSVAYLMSLCDHRFTTTQFALFSSLMAIGRDLLSTPSGQLAKLTGWPSFFLLSMVAALPGLLLLPIVAPWKPQPQAIGRPGLGEEE